MTTATQTVTRVADTESPVLSGIGSDIFVDCDESYTFSDPSATDNCDSDVVITFVDNGDLDVCDGSAGITRTWTATDDCGNTSTGSQTVYRNPDVEAPVISGVGPNIDVECDESYTFSDPSATDDCDSDVEITFVDNGSLDDCQGGSITRTWTATDDCGNTSTATQTVTRVADTESPVLSGIGSDIFVDCDESYTFSDPSATDNCDSDVVITFVDNGDLDVCDGSAGITRTWTATDDCGNTSTGSQTVYRNPDVEAPVISGVGPNIDVECDESYTFSDPSATDDCDSDVEITFVDNGSLDDCQGGSITRTWTATDDCGNTSTATQTVTRVADTESPVRLMHHYQMQ